MPVTPPLPPPPRSASRRPPPRRPSGLPPGLPSGLSGRGRGARSPGRGAWLLPAVLLLAAACSSVPPLEGMDELESARTYAEWGDQEKALDLAEQVIDKDDVTLEDETEASFLAAEAALALGQDVLALRRYKWILENAPWSEHTVVIEDRLYGLGIAFLTLDRYGGWFDSRARGVEALETLQLHYHRSDKADDALRMVGDYFARDDVREWLEAAITHEQLATEYPDSEWAERSLWLAGHYRLRLVHGPAYNKDEMLRARALLERSLELHPRGSQAREAAADLAAVRDLLARGEVLVADFYAGRGNLPGERLRLANAALLFPETQAGLAAIQRLHGMGLDLATVAADPSQSSIDTFVPPPQEDRPEEEDAP